MQNETTGTKSKHKKLQGSRPVKGFLDQKLKHDSPEQENDLRIYVPESAQ